MWEILSSCFGISMYNENIAASVASFTICGVGQKNNMVLTFQLFVQSDRCVGFLNLRLVAINFLICVILVLLVIFFSSISFSSIFSRESKPSLLNPTGSILVSSTIKQGQMDLQQLHHRAAVIPPMVWAVFSAV